MRRPAIDVHVGVSLDLGWMHRNMAPDQIRAVLEGVARVVVASNRRAGEAVTANAACRQCLEGR